MNLSDSPVFGVAENAGEDAKRRITARLRPVPDGFPKFAHSYITATCVGTVRSAGPDEYARAWALTTTEQALHEFLDALLDSWQVSDITRRADIDAATSGYFLHNAAAPATRGAW